ncbi:unnamed protein product, partial [Iphiclides podalirius]
MQRASICSPAGRGRGRGGWQQRQGGIDPPQSRAARDPARTSARREASAFRRELATSALDRKTALRFRLIDTPIVTHKWPRLAREPIKV